MDYDISEYDEAYDSDFIDEELESQLYGAVFFETAQSLPSIPQPEPIQSVHTNVSIQSKSILTEMQVEESQSFHKNNTESEDMIISINSNPSKNNVRISSFEDVSTSDSEDNELSTRSYNQIPLSDQSTIEDSGDFTSSSSMSKREHEKKMNCRNNWGPEDVVLGVSFHSVSSICNVDDSTAIAERLASSSNDPNMWQICYADRFPSRTSRNRYFDNVDNSFCFTCKRKGHMTHECERSGPACILCGEEGHEQNECRKRYCYACLAPGHTKDSCSLRGILKNTVCKRCGQQGHNSSLCTELWRQYRNTTQPGKPVPGTKNVRPRGCCNCGRRGHCVDECVRKPFRSCFLGPLPKRRVLVYDKKDIYKVFRQRLSRRRKRLRNLKTTKKIDKETRISKAHTELRHSVKLCEKKTLKSKREIEAIKDQNEIVNLERSVSKKLFKKVVDQEISVVPPPSPSSAIYSDYPKKSTGGEHFLPLKSKRSSQLIKPKGRIKKKSTNSSYINSTLSPFLWINRHTDQNFHETNDYQEAHNASTSYISDDESIRMRESIMDYEQPKGRRSRSMKKIRRSSTCPSLTVWDSNYSYEDFKNSKQSSSNFERKTKNYRSNKNFRKIGKKKPKCSNSFTNCKFDLQKTDSDMFDSSKSNNHLKNAFKRSGSISHVMDNDNIFSNHFNHQSIIEPWNDVQSPISSKIPQLFTPNNRSKRISNNKSHNRSCQNYQYFASTPK